MSGFTLPAWLKSVAFAANGLLFLLRNERNARIHLGAAILIVAAGLALGLHGPDWRWIATAVLWVWFAEAVNTAIEHLCDVVSPGRNQSVRVVKDVAAGAVLISAAGAALIGLITLLSYVAPLLPAIGGSDTLSRWLEG